MLLNLLRGNLLRVELVAWATAGDSHRSEPGVADSRGEIHLHHHLRVTLLRAHDSQTGQGSMYKSSYTTYEALTQAWEHASCGSYICDGSMLKSLR